MSNGLEELGIVDDAGETAFEPVPDERPRGRVAAGPVDAVSETRAAEIERTLEQVSLFAGLLPVHLKRIARLARELQLGKNAHVFHHGDEGDGLYLILGGAIRISRHVSGVGEEALAVLRPGHYFGEMSIIDDEMPRSADAIVHEQAHLLMLPKDDLRDLMFVDRELAYELLWRFVRTLSGRLRESNDRLLMLTVSSKF
jgi:CRP-like cAMP-binding protein